MKTITVEFKFDDIFEAYIPNDHEKLKSIFRDFANFNYRILDTKAIKTEPKKSDIGKCTKCKFVINNYCNVGTYYAKQGKNKLCIEGELWEPINAIIK